MKATKLPGTFCRRIAWILTTTLISYSLGCSSEGSNYDFTFSEGEQPWLTHIPSEINTTLEEALDQNRYLRGLLCNADGTDDSASPFKRVQPICLQGGGAKMVVPLGYPTWSHYVYISPMEGGFFEQKHMTEGQPEYYSEEPKSRTKYFLIPFNDYEIPTFTAVESQMYLPVWKRVFQATNEMSNAYFDAHIRVMSAGVKRINYEGRIEQRFWIIYYFHVDWAQMKLRDGFTIGFGEDGLHDILDSITLSDSLRTLEERLKRERTYRGKHISKVASVSKIATKREIVQAVKTASPLLKFSMARRLRLDPHGNLVLKLYGTIDESANRCLRASIRLNDASVFDFREGPCRIY